MEHKVIQEQTKITRKQLVVDNFLPIPDELNLTKLTLTKHPKSDQIFSYKFIRYLLTQRRFLIQRLAKNQPENFCDIIQSELDQSWKACFKYKRNYYAWTYRGWLLSYLNTTQV